MWYMFRGQVNSGEIITAKEELVDQSRGLARAEAVLTNEQNKTVAKYYVTFMKWTRSQKEDGV